MAHYHFGYLFNPSGLGTVNVCVTQGNDGDLVNGKYGFEYLAYGSIDPEFTKLGQRVYAFNWDATGLFLMRFGDIGNEPIPDVPNILVRSGNRISIILIWSDINLRYEGNDLAVATDLIDNYVEGADTCSDVIILPNLVLDIDFTLMRGTA